MAVNAYRSDNSCSLEGVVPSAASLRVLRALESAGLEAWYVGGWVRDAIMGVPSHDVDMCCSGSWEESERALLSADIDVVRSGIKFGGITAVVEGERIEVTTYRLDGFYTDGRHPDEVVRAGTISEDLARRDFTVNAMAWHPERGVLDLFDGRGDIQARVIRAVGEPAVRFREDALRMLRAVRFACRLDFAIEPATCAALAECAPLLDAVANERVGIEMCGILATRHGGDAMLRYPELICAAIPELAAARDFDQCSPYHAFSVYEHIARALTVAGELSRFRIDGGDPDSEASLSLMWAACLHDVGKPACFTQDAGGRGHFYGHPEEGAKMARSIMRRLGLSDMLVRDACTLIRYHDMPVEPERTSLLHAMQLFDRAGCDVARLMGELFDLKRADTLGKAPSCFYYVEEIERMREMVRELVANGDAYSVKMLAIGGRDLIDAGVRPGPRLGELLERALQAVMDGRVRNEAQPLLAYLGLA
ncbi:HD domain-containing protein [Collinsella sp. BA40]|uniref:CCA tRNA nucleotidyltransferase n=1 Tax=Collinsella sp. BA40 TaxID=2560852 RepID=UPI0011C8BC35|nr:HD domain-containing protein [Collinsella sp. BA40]TXF36575.1 HD domain-containing protein [Collinsella sp. BA40]